uniref:Salivary thrombin inhibitor anophelin n=1 Tax=Anopheles culicifacies TaxID=139723 RepID=A0A182M6C1_9DIPT
MATKVIVIAFLCASLVAIVQSAPQYSAGEDPTYDDDDFTHDELKPHSSADSAADHEEFDPSLLSEDFANAPDPGRRPEFLHQDAANSPNESQLSDSSSAEQ